MNILVTGAKGQLGSEFKYLSNNYNDIHFVFTSRSELNISDSKSIEETIVDNNINVIVNCAAYTAVDLAEDKKEEALNINCTAVKNIVEVCEKHNVKLIHYSTDYVFDGAFYKPYRENHKVDPVNYYGYTKLKGEEAIEQSLCESIIIRTSWVYSSFGNNFVKTISRLAEERDKLNIIFDQVGTPTYARDLAESTLNIILNNSKIDSKGKVYHYSNEGVCSWYDFAEAICNIKGISCEITPINTEDYPTKAKRPNYSVLNKQKIKNDFDIKIRHWRESLIKCLKEI